MKTKIITILTCFGLLISIFGCKSIPDDAKMYTVSYAVGAATAKVVDMSNINDKTTEVIVKTMNSVQLYVPATNETFTSKWTPIISLNVSTMVKSGELTEIEATFIEKTFKVVCNGLDYLIEKRFPEANMYENLMSSAIYGFNAGFLTYFKPSKLLSARTVKDSLDKEEYLKAIEFLKSCQK